MNSPQKVTVPSIMLYPDFKNFVTRHKLIHTGEGVVVSVSGGVDSMVLLHLVHRLARSWRLRIIVAHVNHMLRGRESNADEELVRITAQDLHVPFETLRKKPKGSNIQDSARGDRLQFLKRIAAKHLATTIATAHHRGDQAETVLIHLLRGTGLRGLAGLRPWNQIGDFRLIRPLLFAPRTDIERYAKKYRIPFREDSSNKTTKYTRNSVRIELLPALEKFNPRIEAHLSQLAGRLAEDDDALAEVAAASFEEVLIPTGSGGVNLRRDVYAALPKGLRSRILRLAFQRASGSMKDLNRDQIARMDEIACSRRRRGTYNLPASLKFGRKGDILSIESIIS